ncbi:MAG: nitroreductase family protein [Candidatus Thorarchaeota archaeon]
MLRLPVESWFEAIFLRHSQRKYSLEIPRNEVVERLDKVCTEFRPFPGARAYLVKEPADNVFKGIIGSYFKITNAPYYITLIGNMRAPNVQAITGYLGEGIILEATALGLNTCWVGGFYRRETVMKQVELQDHEHVLGITPIGYSMREGDRVGKSSKQYRRKDLDKLVAHGDVRVGSWVESSLKAARIAPSAANRQPWRFRINEDSITVSSDKKRRGFGVSKRLDCGIAMLHVELGARAAGVGGSWDFLPHPGVATYRVDQTDNLSE